MPSFSRHRRRGDSIVAGQHDDLDAVILQHLERFRGRRLDRIGNADESGGAAVDRDEHHGLAIFALRVGVGGNSVDGDAERAHQRAHCRAQQRAPRYVPVTPWPVTDLKSSADRERQLALFGACRRSRPPADARCRARGWRRVAKRRRR